MHRRLLLPACAVIALLLGASTRPGLAQTGAPASPDAVERPGPFADVQWHTWPYEAVDTLQKAGIVIGYPDGTYGGRRTMTRYEFAVAIARLLPLLSPAKAPPVGDPDLNALRGDLQTKFEQNPLAPNAMLALMDEFQYELTRLGQSDPANGNRVGAARGQLLLWKSRQAAGALTPAQARSPFADVSPDDPAYGLVDALQQAGVLITVPKTTSADKRLLTRLQLATEVSRLLPLLHAPTATEKANSGLRLLEPPQQDLIALLVQHPPAVTTMTALVKEFTPELRLLWRDDAAALTRLATLPPRPFPDASEKQWASQSVETVHQAGILVGYPNGAFFTDDGHD